MEFVRTHGRRALSRLGQFMTLNGISLDKLAEHSGVSRRYLAQLRFGACSPTLRAMKWIAGGASDILHSRVHLHELFDLDYATYFGEEP